MSEDDAGLATAVERLSEHVQSALCRSRREQPSQLDDRTISVVSQEVLSLSNDPRCSSNDLNNLRRLGDDVNDYCSRTGLQTIVGDVVLRRFLSANKDLDLATTAVMDHLTVTQPGFTRFRTPSPEALRPVLERDAEAALLLWVLLLASHNEGVDCLDYTEQLDHSEIKRLAGVARTVALDYNLAEAVAETVFALESALLDQEQTRTGLDLEWLVWSSWQSGMQQTDEAARELRCLRALELTEDNLDRFDDTQIYRVLASAVRSAMELCRYSMAPEYRRRSIAILLRAESKFAEENIDGVWEILGSSLDEIPVVRSIERPSVGGTRGTAFEGTPKDGKDVFVIQQGCKATISQSLFNVCIYIPKKYVKSGLIFDVYPDGQTSFARGCTPLNPVAKRSTSLFVASFVAGPNEYTASIIVIVRDRLTDESLIFATLHVNVSRSTIELTDKTHEIDEVDAKTATAHVTVIIDNQKVLISGSVETWDSHAERQEMPIRRPPNQYIAMQFGKLRTILERGIHHNAGIVPVSAEWPTASSLLDSLALELKKAFRETVLDEIFQHAASHGLPLSVSTNSTSIPWQIYLVGRPENLRPVAEFCPLTVMGFDGALPGKFHAATLRAAILDRPLGTQSNERWKKHRHNLEREWGGDRKFVSVGLSRQQFLGRWNVDPPGFWYLVSHGSLDNDTNAVSIATDENDASSVIRLPDLLNAGSTGSLIVLNFCDSGSPQDGLFETTSWPDELQRAGAAGVVCARWPISDVAADIFGVHFVRALVQDGSVAKAVLTARSAVREATQAAEDPSWLAFSYHGNANLELDMTDYSE